MHAGWFYDLDSERGLQEFLNGFTPGQVGVAIQSTERFTPTDRRAMVRRITENSEARADARGSGLGL